MNVKNPFINHPYVAVVMAIVITLCGAIALATLPVAQYPNVTPPSIQISATYPGADARTLLETVVEPIEQQVNGVRDLLYLSSTSSDSGSAVITATFDIGTDGETDTQNVQSRVNWATPQLPQAVQSEGVTVREQSGNILLAISLYSPGGTYDSLFLSNFANIQLVNELKRIPGVAEVQLFGGSDFAMRIWLNEEKLAGIGMSIGEVLSALKTQNLQISSGSVGAAPANAALRYNIRTQGRLVTAEDFGKIVLRTTSEGAQVLLRDVAKIELGSETYTTVATLDNRPAVMIAVFQLNSANALKVADACRDLLARAGRTFPPDLAYGFQYDSTRFIQDSIQDVERTLLAAVGLVALVVFLFLQNWRMALVPVLAIPVSIVGTFAVLKLFGFSLNLVTLFALILAIGIVVDDAIIVIENVSRLMEKEGLSPREAATKSMREITGAIVATTLVLLAMFLPITFLPGITGELYRQFGVTLTVAVLLSALNALTLSPALAGVLLRPAANNGKSGFFFFRWFNAGFDKVSGAYRSLMGHAVRVSAAVLILYFLIVGGAAWWFSTRPGGFIPAEDQGVFFANLQLGGGSSLAQTEAAAREAVAVLKSRPGVRDVIAAPGFNILSMTPAPNNAFAIVVLDNWKTRLKRGLDIGRIMMMSELALMEKIPNMLPMLFEPPAIPGIGMAGGFTFVLEDASGTDPARLAKILDEMLFEAMKTPGLRNIFSTFNASNPYLYLNIDRAKALRMGISMEAIDNTLENMLGFNFINEFNRFGRVYKVELQALKSDRDLIRRINELHVPNRQGTMVPFSSFATHEIRVAPESLNRYNLNLSANIQGAPAPGFSSGEAMRSMERVAAKILPSGMRYDWTGMSYQETLSGAQTQVIFLLAVIFIYLFLAALYESWLLPFPVLLAIPAALLGALALLTATGVDNNLYTQIGIVLLFGMACKTAILVVDFAKQKRDAGGAPDESALHAASLRFRAVLMTAFAFVFGTLPLAFAVGPGAGSQRSIGVVVVGGMIAGTVGVLLLIPLFYTVFQKIIDRFRPPSKRHILPLLFVPLFLLLIPGCYTPPPGGALIDERHYKEPELTGDLKLIRELPALNLEDACRIALENSPTYRSAHYAIESARMRYYQALGAYSPSFSASFALGQQLYDGQGTDGGRSDVFYTFTTVQANWILFDGLAREFALLSARHGVRLNEQLEANARRTLLQSVSYAWLDLVNAHEKLASAEADMKFQQEQLHDAELKHKSGDIPRSEVLNFKTKWNQARMNKVKAVQRIEIGLHSLAVLMGYPAGTLPENLKFQPPDDQTARPVLPVEFYLDQALANRSDLNAFREEIRIAEYSLYTSYSAFLPVISAFANYSYSSNSTQNSGNNPTGFGNFYQQGNSFNYGGVAELTLFNGLIRYNRVRALKNDLNQIRLRGSDFWLKVVQQVRDARTNLRNAQELCKIARIMHDTAREQRDLALKEYQAGDVPLVRLDQAQDLYIQSENDWLEAESAVRRAVIALESATESLPQLK